MADGRVRLAKTEFASIEAMMRAYAGEAVAEAERHHGRRLDYTERSVDALEAVLEALAPPPEADREWLTMLWGGYFGELLVRLYDGAWRMTEYPSRDPLEPPMSVPTVEIRGSRLYPLIKVHRRLTMGPAEALPAFFALVRQRLGAPLPAPG